jgi:CubicO group peptidase (beta-lactamase class C family)
MRTFRTLLVCAIGACFIMDAHAQSFERADGKKLNAISADTIVERLMKAAEVTGLELAIVNKNKLVYAKSYGYKNTTAQTLNDTATCFYAASLSKSLFAFLVMQLMDERIIDLDKPVYTYLPKPLPEYADYKDLAGDERWKLITGRHCLSHTTGLPNWRQFNPRGNKKLEIFFTPGERYAYSGEGIFLLQMVIETITGKKLEEIAREKIFNPLGMTRTSYIWQPSFETNYAVGHSVSEVPFQKSKRSSANAAGSMETTAADYARFVASVMRGKNISKASLAEMLRPQVYINQKRQFPSLNTDTTSANRKFGLAYGLGWGLLQLPQGKAFFKEGHGDGWQNYVICFPEKQMAFLFLANSDNAESIYKELVERIVGVSIPWEWESYIPYLPFVQLPQEQMQQFVGTYDGRLKAIITLENGRLKIASPTVKLPPTNMYATNDHQFFLKIMDVKMDFRKNAEGKFDKVIVEDEGERYELTRQP